MEENSYSTIRSIRVLKEDNAVITALVNTVLDKEEGKSSAGYLQKLLADKNTYLIAAILHDAVIGYVLAYKFPSLYTSNYVAYLYDIEIEAQHRRKGAASHLMHALLNHLRYDGVAELWLGTATDNHAAQALFAATGGISSDETFKDFTYTLL